MRPPSGTDGCEHDCAVHQQYIRPKTGADPHDKAGAAFAAGPSPKWMNTKAIDTPPPSELLMLASSDQSRPMLLQAHPQEYLLR